MRLCRFSDGDITLAGFYDDEFVIPIDQASEMYCEEVGVELLFANTTDLLELLPPCGASYHAIRELASWVGDLGLHQRQEIALPHDEVTLLTPIGSPGKILMLAGNYASYVVERGGVAPVADETFPYLFMKPPSTTLTHPGAPIILPRVSPDYIDWECELGVVIGRRCRHVAERDALSYVAGYTVVNDISDRKFAPNPDRSPRENDKFFDWLHGKWHDTFCPIGPCISSADSIQDPQSLAIRLEVNGQLRQSGCTGQMIFTVAAVIAFLSRFVTLEPGDVIATGTPSGVGSASGTYLRPGDVVRASIRGIGVLENPVILED